MAFVMPPPRTKFDARDLDNGVGGEIGAGDFDANNADN